MVNADLKMAPPSVLERKADMKVSLPLKFGPPFSGSTVDLLRCTDCKFGLGFDLDPVACAWRLKHAESNCCPAQILGRPVGRVGPFCASALSGLRGFVFSSDASFAKARSFRAPILHWPLAAFESPELCIGGNLVAPMALSLLGAVSGLDLRSDTDTAMLVRLPRRPRRSRLLKSASGPASHKCLLPWRRAQQSCSGMGIDRTGAKCASNLVFNALLAC